MLVPFAIEPVLGKGFRPLLPAAIPAAQRSNFSVAGCMGFSAVAQLPADAGLKLAVESAPRKVPSRKGPRKLRVADPLGFIRQELRGVDVSGRPHASYALTHALPDALQPALAMSLHEMSAQSAPDLMARAEGFTAVAPAGAAPQPAGAMREESPSLAAPAPVRLPSAIEIPASTAQFSNGLETRVSYPEAQGIAATRLPHAGPLPFPASEVVALPQEPRLEIQVASPPALAARVDGFAAIAPAETTPRCASTSPVDLPTLPTPAAARLPLPLEISLPAPVFQREDAECPVSYGEIRPGSAAVRADVELAPFRACAAAPGLRLELELEVEAESAPTLPARAKGFAAISPEATPSRASELEVASAVLPVATPVRLPLPIGASQPAAVLASNAEVLPLPCVGITPVTAATPAGVEPLRFAAVAAEPKPPAGLFATSDRAGLQIAIESTPALPALADSFAAVEPCGAAPSEARGLDLELPVAPWPIPALLPFPIETPAHSPWIAGENAVVQIAYPEVRVAAAAGRAAVAPEPLAALASALRLPNELGLQPAIESAPALPAQVKDFAAAPLGAAPTEPLSLAVALPVVPGPTPVLLPVPVETPAHAPAKAPAVETAVVPISYPEVRKAAAAAQAGIDPLPFAAVLGPSRLPGELEVKSAPARAEDFVTVEALFPGATETPESTDADFERHPPAEADLVPLEYYCQRSPITPALHAEWTRRAIPRILPELSFDKVVGAIEDLLPEKDAAKPFFAATTKVENRRWGGRYLELAAAAVVLATVLATGLHIARSVGTETPKMRRDEAAVRVNAGPAPMKPSSGPLAQIRNVIASRAAVEISDSFRSGMEAWGHVKSPAPGWKRSPDGYTQPGQLALFQPSMKFTDYRMEFLGQIESKSIDWVVRAKDLNNYYAMKFTVIEKGLRPVIAVVHYPVVAGKPGRRSTVPLSVMVHNKEAYHIDVSVRGSLIVTSIEGQEVDRWSEDSVRSGGVGFFSEADERARVYWVKVAKNEDFLGRLCAYITGGSSTRRDEAMLVPQGFQSIRSINQGVIHGFEFFAANPYRN